MAVTTVSWCVPGTSLRKSTSEPDFAPRHDLDAIDLVACFRWDESTFLSHTEGSAIRRIGFQQWRRNVAIALGNAETSETIITALKSALDDPSELVREHVRWALGPARPGVLVNPRAKSAFGSDGVPLSTHEYPQAPGARPALALPASPGASAASIFSAY